MRYTKLFLVFVIGVLCVAVSSAFAADNGIAGSQIIDMLEKLLKDNTVAVSIYTAIVGLISIGMRILLKKLPTVMQGIMGAIFWKIAAALFGSGVVLENHKDPKYVKAQLIKKYPMFQIDIKKMAEGDGK